ncbi:RNA recognition motif domain-containing protein [Ditylenchus destructor]|nr:RNA recognition motif domain-containing protein [Ditylenchus destructor]
MDDNVDDLLEKAFQRVEDVDKNGSSSKYPMDDIVMAEARRQGIENKRNPEDMARGRAESRRRKHSPSSSEEDAPDSKREDSKDREKGGKKKRSRSRDRKQSDSSRDRKKRSPSERQGRKRSGSRERKRRSRTRSRSGSKDRKRRERSPERRRRSRSRSFSRPKIIDHRGSPPWRRSPPPRSRLPGPERRDVLDSLSMPFTPRRSPPKNAKMDMTPEERDERTVFILQLSRNTRPRDLEEFFSSVGHVRDVRIITDSKTRRSKGIAYVEFWEREGVALAMGLNGQKLLGCPLVIQMTCAERNRAAASTMGGAIGLGLTNSVGPLKLCVSNLHPHITDDMLSAIFEPFGKIDRCKIERDSTASSKGFGYVEFRHTDEGKRAVEQLNGFELAAKNIRITFVDDDDSQRAQPQPQQQQMSLESEDKMGISSAGRLELMAKLAQGTGAGTQVPQSTRDAIANQQAQSQQAADGIPAIATQCFMLSNMFDPTEESQEGWEQDVRDDVIEECESCVHIYVDKASQGNVYVKCPTVAIAHKSVMALHGRWFAGKVITANYVPVNSYHELFPDSRYPTASLKPRKRQ